MYFDPHMECCKTEAGMDLEQVVHVFSHHLLAYSDWHLEHRKTEAAMAVHMFS